MILAILILVPLLGLLLDVLFPLSPGIVNLCFWHALAAWAPAIVSGIGSLFSHKAKQSAEKRAFEERQNSPEARAAQYRARLQYEKLIGHYGGKDKTPAAIRNYFEAILAAPVFRGAGGGGWGLAGDLLRSASYYNPKAKKGGSASYGASTDSDYDPLTGIYLPPGQGVRS